MNTYELGVVPIPTNKPVRPRRPAPTSSTRARSPSSTPSSTTSPSATRRGQPVLVGTVSVEKSEYLSRQLNQRGIPHEVLNAKQHTAGGDDRRPGRPPARRHRRHQHGRPRRRHPPRRQPRGAGPPRGAQGGPRPRGDGRRRSTCRCRSTRCPRTSARPGPRRWPATTSCSPSSREQCTAEGDKVRELGGLYVIGSERHESRRIDNQLRGRSGRQGDPGESRFYLSLDDELMRLFATGALSYVMNKALPDDEAIEAKMVTKAIERAQTTVEMRNAEIRKNVLKYDEVMNEQRKVIYARPRPDPRGRGPQVGGDGVPRRGRRRAARDVLRQPGRRRVGPRRPGTRS